ncbi:MAG: signal recognition particle-docking protein FtsY [candidate division Zixibacteria bacterium RBG_16_43_9]|nr:MAG: signal recognition particle-docking protein FtsY [candidate division Zixibacteria bacterium RBG_16_43_9]
MSFKFSIEKLKQGLSKTKKSLFGKITEVVGLSKKIDQELLDKLEEVLLKGDVGVKATEKIIQDLKNGVKEEKIVEPQKIIDIMKEEILTILQNSQTSTKTLSSDTKPLIIMIVGVNGTGKTTSIAKLAKRYSDQGKKVMVAACDTFRAAALEQLSIWAQRAGVDIVKSQPNQDPASVAFDAVKSALAKKIDVVIVDTAGRLHTKYNLMEELKKIKRVMGKSLEGAPQEVFLVLDATTGQNGISQAKMFDEAVGLTGIILAKLDGTAKGGIVIAIANELKIPVKYVGLGERIDDLEKFDPKDFVEVLFL